MSGFGYWKGRRSLRNDCCPVYVDSKQVNRGIPSSIMRRQGRLRLERGGVVLFGGHLFLHEKLRTILIW